MPGWRMYAGLGKDHAAGMLMTSSIYVVVHEDAPAPPLAGGVDGGLHITDVSNASRTNLMDLRTLSWHEPTLRLFGVPPAMLPQIRSNAEVYG